MSKVTGYGLTKAWYEFAEKAEVKLLPSHHALYNYILHLANVLMWPTVFGLPTEVTMHRTSIRNFKTYKKALLDLVEFGFIELVEEQKNQYTANRISLVIRDEHSEPKEKPIEEPKKLTIHEDITDNEKKVEFKGPVDDRIQNATKKIADFFGVSEIKMASHYSKIGRFVFEINRLGEIEHLKEQFVAYAGIKKETGFKHEWYNWIGTEEGGWMDGFWNKSNWSEKLKEQKNINGAGKDPAEIKLPDYNTLLKKQKNG